MTGCTRGTEGRVRWARLFCFALAVAVATATVLAIAGTPEPDEDTDLAQWGIG